MKPVTADWLRSARADLETISAILDNPALTAVIAFHSQQCIEKCLKALLEEIGTDIGKTHNLLTLKAAVEQKYSLDLDEDTLSLLNQLYIDSRYPGQFGLLPSGSPTLEDAGEFSRSAREALRKVCSILGEPFPE